MRLLRCVNPLRCEFQSLTEAIDTTLAEGELVFRIVRAFAAIERALIIERTKVGVGAARKRG